MRMIDADNFDERMRIAVGMCEYEVTEDFKEGVQATLTMLKTEPTIEQPEIIRCKDCKWKDGSECVRFAEIRPFPNDFCSRAERKTDG